MLAELIDEKAKGRLSGPFRQPSDWPVDTVSMPDHPLMDLPDHEIFAACSFSVERADKIRRTEDWTASFPNQTIRVNDVPTHHGVAQFVESAKICYNNNVECLFWGHDLDAAYQQLVVRRPNLCYVLLLCHLVHHFGDIARCNLVPYLLFGTSIDWQMQPCIDDFSTVEPAQIADSGFESFSRVFAALGLHVKQKKAQPPRLTQKLLSAFFSVTPTGISLEPCPVRIQRMDKLLDEILTAGVMSASTVQRLAGKLNFLNTTIFGQSGAAALYPVYARAARAHGSSAADTSLSNALRNALFSLKSLLHSFRPRWISFSPPVCGFALH